MEAMESQHLRLLPHSQVHLYLPNKIGGTIRIGKALLITSTDINLSYTAIFTGDSPRSWSSILLDKANNRVIRYNASRRYTAFVCESTEEQLAA